MKFFSRLKNSHEYRARKLTLLQLQSMSDRQLTDCGFSPDLVNQGIKAWPWRELPETGQLIQLSKRTESEQINPADEQSEEPAHDLDNAPHGQDASRQARAA